MRMESLRPVGDTLRFVKLCSVKPNGILLVWQMVWARTYAVGCGAFRCAELPGAEDANENVLFLVCYYGPG